MAEVIPHWLSKQAFLAPNQIAIETNKNEKMTFQELKEASESFAKKLARLGITEGSHIGIFSSNDKAMVIAIHALSYIGAVAVLLNTRLTKEELAYQIKDAEVFSILTCDHLGIKIKQMNFTIPITSFSDVAHLKEKQVSLRTEINLGDVFTIIYTSGTTGFPKGVVHTYGNHWWSAIGSALNLGIRKNDKWLAMLPLFHIGGLSIFIKSVIYGMPVLLLEKFDVQVVNEMILKRKVTIISVVTVMVQRLLVNLGTKEYPKSFRCMLLGGGPAPKTMLEVAKERDIPVFQSYGMTETSSQIATLSPQDALVKIGSAGKPLFPGQLTIHHPGPDGIGEIYVKGPMVAQTYYKNEQATEEAFHNNWLATGDLGYLDKEGFLYVVDRRTDLIISGGENVYPSEIENILVGMDLIREVGVVGKKDEIWGQVPVAFVVRENETVSSEEIIAYAKKYLASYKIPKEIIFMNQLPRNASNKIVRRELMIIREKNSSYEDM